MDKTYTCNQEQNKVYVCMPWSLDVVTSHGELPNMAIPNIRTSDFLPEKYSRENTKYALNHWLSYIDFCEAPGLNNGQRET